jgi:molybdopterin-guanine dinucleotide biosynthesis protein A
VGKQYEHPQLSGCLNDEVSGVGPLGGMLTALHATATELNFFIAIDYPLIDPHVVSLLAEEAIRQHRDGKQGLIPVMPDGPHPLFAFYTKACVSAVRRCIDNGSLRVQCIAGHCSILYLDMTTIEDGPGFDSLERTFVNINHTHDLKKIIP